MPGPNSAPNGDRSLTLSAKAGGVIECRACKGVFPMREHLAKHKTLRTGKTGK